MKHPTVILLTLFVLQIYALPHPTFTLSSRENKESTSGNVGVDSKDSKSDSSSIFKDIKIEQKSPNDIIEKGLKSSTSDILGSISTETKEVESKNNEKTTKTERLESKSLMGDDFRSTSTKTEKDQKSISENAGAESKSSTNEPNNIPKITKTDQKSSSRPLETSRSNKDRKESGSQIESLQRPPSYYYDMFNIPITALQAVSNFLGGTPTNSYTRPPASPKPPASKEYLRSPIEMLSRSPEGEPASGVTTDSAVNVPNSPGLNLINQLSQVVQSRPGLLFRIPTIQDIFNIPISTLNAVSHFLAENYAAQPAPVISSPPALAPAPAVASNVLPAKVPIEGTPALNKERLKSGQILQTLENIPDHSTLIGVSEEVATSDQDINELHIKQILLSNPNYYRDMINIPLATIKAVSNFLTTVYLDPSIAALPSVQENRIKIEELSAASTKTSGDVRADAVIPTKWSSRNPQVTDASSENSGPNGPAEDRIK